MGIDIGQSQYLTTPITAKPLNFNLALDDRTNDNDRKRHSHNSYLDRDDEDDTTRLEDSDARLMEMLAAQAAHREVDPVGAGEDDIATDDQMSVEEKRDLLQKSLNMAASNGDVERVRKLVGGKAKDYIDVNMPDEEGTVPLIYASCFVSSPRMWGLGVVLMAGNRDTKRLYRRFLRRGHMSTNRIRTSGAR
jgi:hypothetical protein